MLEFNSLCIGIGVEGLAAGMTRHRHKRYSRDVYWSQRF
jgi:hypothetical protein